VLFLQTRTGGGTEKKQNQNDEYEQKWDWFSLTRQISRSNQSVIYLHQTCGKYHSKIDKVNERIELSIT